MRCIKNRAQCWDARSGHKEGHVVNISAHSSLSTLSGVSTHRHTVFYLHFVRVCYLHIVYLDLVYSGVSSSYYNSTHSTLSTLNSK